MEGCSPRAPPAALQDPGTDLWFGGSFLLPTFLSLLKIFRMQMSYVCVHVLQTQKAKLGKEKRLKSYHLQFNFAFFIHRLCLKHVSTTKSTCFGR